MQSEPLRMELEPLWMDSASRRCVESRSGWIRSLPFVSRVAPDAVRTIPDASRATPDAFGATPDGPGAAWSNAEHLPHPRHSLCLRLLSGPGWAFRQPGAGFSGRKWEEMDKSGGRLLRSHPRTDVLRGGGPPICSAEARRPRSTTKGD